VPHLDERQLRFGDQILQFSNVLYRWKRLIITVTALGTFLIGITAFAIEPNYTAESQIMIELPQMAGGAESSRRATWIPEQLIATHVATTPRRRVCRLPPSLFRKGPNSPRMRARRCTPKPPFSPVNRCPLLHLPPPLPRAVSRRCHVSRVYLVYQTASGPSMRQERLSEFRPFLLFNPKNENSAMYSGNPGA